MSSIPCIPGACQVLRINGELISRSGDLRDNTPLSPPILDYSKRPLVRKTAISRPPSNSVSSYTPEPVSD